MSTVSTHFKLGLFALIGAGCAVVLVFGLGMSATHRSTIRYETFFDESVQGLELGAPVKYRGIVVGNVENIAVAPDRRLVDVTLGVDPARASELA
jgi:phospholipid/cholesterol/gamma-HCH transport system substrate-binding protein